MNFIEILFVSVGLSMDAFAAAVCKGLSMKKMSWKKACIIGIWFGFFQAIMPIMGYFLGSTFDEFVTSIDHWIAFFLLGAIGINMICEALSKGKEEENQDINFKEMFLLALATSIDALTIGIAYVCNYGSYNAPITFISIGVVTFFISVLGVKIGNKFGDKYEKKSQLFGGAILIFLAFKILLESII